MITLDPEATINFVHVDGAIWKQSTEVEQMRRR